VIDPAARVHASAELDADVTIGPGSVVWDRAVLRRGAHIGADTTIGRDALIDEDVTIGSRVTIHSGALIYRGVTVEDGVSIGPRAILTNDRYPRTVGADDSVTGEHDDGTIRLAHGSSIGAGAIVVAGSSVGRFATVGAGAVVTHEVPSHALVAGNPAHRIGWVCTCGNRLSDASGAPAPAEVERYGSDPFLTCTRCERRYVYVPDQDSLEERRGPAVRTASPA
jgi:acetyltransferase-like isoleucine patch superfamily enzyme